MAREAGWAEGERNRVFNAALEALRNAGLPAQPLPADYQNHRILRLKGPGEWLRYFLWAEPAPNRLAAGLYVPKGRYGAAVHYVLLRDEEALSRALGAPILQHKEVQREFRHYVRREHRFRPETDADAVRWCVEKIRASHDFVHGSQTLLSSKALRAIQAELVAPTDDPVVLANHAELLLSAGEIEKPPGNQKPQRRLSPPGERFVRDPSVVAYVQQRARGRCEACLEKAPFEKDDGTPFLEIHHLVRLADGGPDTVENAIAVCPNCHRRLHHGADRNELTSRIRGRILRKAS